MKTNALSLEAPPRRPPRRWILPAAVLVASCGGGGSSDGNAGSDTVVGTASVAVPRFGQPLVLTLSGSHLDQGIGVTATGCSGVALLTTPPQASNAGTAYYQCTVSAVGAGQFTVARMGDGRVLSTVPYTVPAPQVTMTLGNGAGVGGTLVFALAADKAPLTVANFLRYVNAGFYVGTVIHRVSPGFVIQGGGYVAPVASNTPTLKPTSAPIALEVGNGLSNTPWTVAMARTSASDSATSQFFINLVDNSGSLDPGPLTGAGYAVFGSVGGSTGTVTAIAGAPCVAIPLFLPTGECTPTPNMVIIAAVQSQ